MNRDEMTEVARRYKATGQYADRDLLVRTGTYWAFALAGQYARSYGASHVFSDLLQEAHVGLINAAEKYDPSLGFAFSTVASYYMRSRITRFLIDQLESVRLPNHRYCQVRKLWRVVRSLEQKLERKPDDDEVIAAGFDPEVLQKIRRDQFVGVVSLDEPFPGKNHDAALRERTLRDIIPDDRAMALFVESAVSADARRAILALFEKCIKKPRDREIMALRFGLNGGPPKTLQEIGEQFHVTRERVRQIEKKILGKPSFKWFATKTLRSMEGIQKRSRPKSR